MKNVNQQYQELLFNILEKGYQYTDTKRNVECLQIDSATLHIDMTDGFPALTTKRLYWKGVVAELLWFLRGSTDIRELWEHNVHIWDEDWFRWHKQQYNRFDSIEEAKNHYERAGKIDKESFLFDLGRIYGAQWRGWRGDDGSGYSLKSVDQFSELLKGMKDMPMSRRHIVDAWNPAEMDDMALPPCHWAFECIVRPLSGLVGKKDEPLKKQYGFTLKWHQRSVDTFLGLPFNIASYALLGHIIEKLTGYKFLGLIGDLSNVHLYENAWDAARELVKRDPLKHELPTIDTSKIVDTIAWDDGRNGTTLDYLVNHIYPHDIKFKNYYPDPNDFNVPMLAPIE